MSLLYADCVVVVSLFHCCPVWCFFFSSRRRHTRCALVTGVQTCALPICRRRDQHPRRDLPVDAPFILAPAAHAFLPAMADDRVPIAVGFLLAVGDRKSVV